MFTKIKIVLTIIGLIISTVQGGDGKKTNRIERSVDKTSEKSIYADISIGMGVITLNKGTNHKVFDGEFLYFNQSPDIEYEIVGDEGRLSIDFDEFENNEKEEDQNIKNLSSLNDLYENECRLRLSDKLPISLNLDLGVVKGELDLGGLQLQDISISSGVSQAYVNFEEPNPITLESFNIEAGVGDLELSKLGNANFEYFKFDGGIGNYVLDFTGEIKQSAEIDIEVGLGKVNIYLPRSAGVRINIEESFLTSLSIDDIYKKDDVYYNDNWGKSDVSLDIDIESEVGKISIFWVDE